VLKIRVIPTYIFTLITENEYGKEVKFILFPFNARDVSLGATFCGWLNEFTLLRSLLCNVVSDPWDPTSLFLQALYY
jgi:hypothetical protein